MLQLQLVLPSDPCSIVFSVLYLFAFLQFYAVVSRKGKVLLSLLLTISKSGRLGEIRWSVCILKFPRILYVSFCRTHSELYIYHLFVWSNFDFLHNSQWITFPTQSCLALYSFSANLLHLFIIWLAVLFLSPHMDPIWKLKISVGCSRGVTVKAMDCGIIVNEFEL